MRDSGALAQLLFETAKRHGTFEATATPHDWWDWYAAYMEAREQGSTQEEAGRGRRALHGRRQARRRRTRLTP